MFTVMHTQDGIDNLYPNAIGVTRRGPHANVGPEGVEILLNDGRTIFFNGSALGPRDNQSGEQAVYVMNEHGKTVAQYRMAASRSSGGIGSAEPLSVQRQAA